MAVAIRVAASALADLEDVHAWYAEQGAPEAAVRLVARVTSERGAWNAGDDEDGAQAAPRDPGQLPRAVLAQLDAAAEDAGVAARYDVASLRFQDLLKTLHRRTGQRVAVLVDEYDKPILDALKTPEVAEANRDYLRGLYSVTKTGDAHIAFSFLTGVSKFAKVSLFSGLNNPTDLTLDPAHAAICGYTEADLDTVFAAELLGLDRDRIREWYNGYNWLGPDRSTTPSTSCNCSAAGGSGRTGSRPARRRFSSTR